MKELESTRPRPELRARILASLPKTPPVPGIRVVYSRPDREHSPHFMPRLALAAGLAMLLVFSAVFALKRLPGASVPGQSEVATGVPMAPQPGKSTADVANTEEPPAKGPANVTYTPQEDPNNALADKLAENEMAEKERAKRLTGQDDLHRLMAQARAAARKTDSAATTTTDMGISLAVPNIAAVREHLPTWAKQEGATFVAMNTPKGVSTENTSVPSPAPAAPPANMVAFYVPAAHGPAFLGALQRLGQISILPLAPRPVVAAIPKPDAAVSSEVGSDGPRKVIPTVPVTADPAASTDRTVAASHDNHPRTGHYLVLTVLLTASHN